MSDNESALSPLEIRLECLRMAVEFGTQRDVLNPVELADKYYDWVVKEGSGAIRPQDHRKDDSHRSAQKTRSVRTVG
jgi:hypothetical protein